MEEELKNLREFEKKTLEVEAKTKEAEVQRKARENEKHKRSIFWILLLVSLMFFLWQKEGKPEEKVPRHSRGQ